MDNVHKIVYRFIDYCVVDDRVESMEIEIRVCIRKNSTSIE